MSISIESLDGDYAIAQLAADAAIPSWCDGDGFVSINRTDDELSVVCLQRRIPSDVKTDRDWRCFRFVGPFAFDETGIALSVIQPLSENGIGIFLVSTFNTDYLLIKSSDIQKAERYLRLAGHRLL
ncbi:MAG: ACT domain-containing protein [Acidihalobacter sp.]